VHVLVGDAWVAGYLDPVADEGWRRVEVVRQVAVAPVSDQYFERAPRISMLVSYVRALGVRRVVRKVVSRRAEQQRNDAWLSIGVGRLAGGTDQPVAFVVPSGAKGAERVVVPEALVHPVEASDLPGATSWLVPREGGSGEAIADRIEGLLALAGWRPESGPAPDRPDRFWDDVRAVVAAPDRGLRVAPDPPPPTPVRERTTADVPAGAVPPSAEAFTLFGYGQYAKTQIVPNLGAGLVLAAVHEIDPLQLGPVDADAGSGPVWDTSPRPRDDERIRTGVLAGYHHTHAPLAVELIDRGARHVVIEKPIATSTDQLDALLDAMARRPETRVHAAFQRRYSPFNDLLRRDLGAGAISLSATVYEVPLPARHWYRWPVVGNAVVSNGCHWIDHFLFLNDYEAPVRHEVTTLSNQVLISMELAGGATCSISLRHEGAPRKGVRDLCTFWSGDATAVIEDNSRYGSERGYRQLRTTSCHRYRSHEDMYREIGRRIRHDLPGDTARSVEVSTRAVLRLAELAGDRTSGFAGGDDPGC
jgi:predicted dehydrogenase